MIVVNGRRIQAEQQQIRPPWTGESLSIFKTMAESPERFAYSSMRELGFELYLREQIVRAAKALQASSASFASFANDRCNDKYWERTGEGGFRLRSDSRPSEAVADIYAHSGKYSFECATAIIIVYYKAVLEALGAAPFDRLFGGLYLHSWQADKDLGLRTFEPPAMIPGDVKYFDNPDVDPKRMVWQGENVVVLGDDRFFGHGIGIASSARIIGHLNRQRKKDANRSAVLLKQTTRPDFAYLAPFADHLPASPFAGQSPQESEPSPAEREFQTATIGSKTYAFKIRPPA